MNSTSRTRSAATTAKLRRVGLIGPNGESGAKWLLRKDRQPYSVDAEKLREIEERNRLEHPEWYEDAETAQ